MCPMRVDGANIPEDAIPKSILKTQARSAGGSRFARFGVVGEYWPLVVVVVVALAARLWRVDWGLPYLYHFDEPNNLIRTLTMVREGDLNPHWFHYGSLMFYLYGGVIASTGVIRGMAGKGDLAAPEPPLMIANGSGQLEDTWVMLTPRIASVALSVATAVVIYFVVRRLTSRNWAAMFSGLLFGLAPVAVSEGRLFTPNTLSALFSAAALGAAILVYERGLIRYYVIAGAFVGMGAGSKYNAGLVGIAVLIAHWLRLRNSGPVPSRGPLVSIYSAIATFVVTTPFALLDADAFLGDVGFELMHYSSGHVGAEEGAAVYVGVILLSFSVAFLLIPLAFTDGRLKGPATITVAFGIGYIAFFSLFQTTFARNLLPALPAFCIAIGLGASASVELVSDKGNIARGVLVGLMSVAVVVAGTAVFLEHQGSENREDAAQWLEENLPSGSLVVIEAYSPWLDPTTYQLVNVGLIAEGRVPNSWDFMLVTEKGSGRYERQPDLYAVEVERLAAIRSSTCLVGDFPGVVEVRAWDCS